MKQPSAQPPASVLPKRWHFIGAGGIGMSALAQLAASLGCEVSGSDRAIHAPENARIFDSLRAQGVVLYPQDGSVFSERSVEVTVSSTAIENNNPDCVATPPSTRLLHRSEALDLLLHHLPLEHLIAVTGTCGKTSVSAWCAEALTNAGHCPGLLSGGLVNAFTEAPFCGNFRAGSGPEFVIEADESDKSLLNYSSDTAVVLNIGTDHYPKEELARVFHLFVACARKHAVLELDAYRRILEVGPLPKHLTIDLFSADESPPDRFHDLPVHRITSYRVQNHRVFCAFDGRTEFALPVPGRHNAANALAVWLVLRRCGIEADSAQKAVASFHGVWRRFDFAGLVNNSIPVYDDYAHNVEKIASAITSARELSDGNLFVVFQPHGFAALQFIRDDLFPELERLLHKGDRFCFLPVYYAGGTAAFTPTSDDVALHYAAHTQCGVQYASFLSRDEVVKCLKSEIRADDLVLILGGRDNSLSFWAKNLVNSLAF